MVVCVILLRGVTLIKCRANIGDEVVGNASLYTKVYHHNIETIEEFLQKFKLQNHKTLHIYRNDETKEAMLLVNTQSIAVSTYIQHRLRSKVMHDATYENIETHLTASYGVKKSLIGASVAVHNSYDIISINIVEDA